MIGSTIGHFKILEKLGEGGMGVVYKALDTNLDRPVALKFLPPHLAAHEHDKKRLVNEAKAASSLDHPNICTIHGVDESDDGRVYIAMAYYEGQTLDKKIAGQPLSIRECLRFALQTAEGLRAAHQKRIVHRDVKSSNIMVTPDGQIKIMDFGLAKSAAATVLTRTGGPTGTVPFMSPEQARGEKVDHRTDIWSFGVVLYQMLAGRLPFQGDYQEALVYLILNEEPPPVSSLNSETPGELEQIVRKCLEKDPQRRYQNMDDVLADLSRQAGIPAAAALSWNFILRKLRNPRIATTVGAVILVTAVLVFGPPMFSDEAGRIDSLAVLPLENLSGDPDQDYLAAGLHEALITDLTKLSGLRRVIARTSVKRYEHSTLSPGRIAGELGVKALLTGSVLRSGDRIQVTAHLINASTEAGMWSERFERKFGDVLVLQNEIVGALTREINLQLSARDRDRLQNPATVNPEAYEAYLQGQFHWRKQTREAYDKAENYFQLALKKDPNYARAFLGLSSVWMMRGDAGFLPPHETFPKAMTLLEKALDLDSTSADARFSKGVHHGIAWEWSAAEAEFTRALELNPNHADARYFLADLLLTLGRTQEWQNEIVSAMELDPLNDFKKSFYGWHLNYVGRYDEAIPLFQKLLTTGPNKASNYLGLWGCYYKKGMFGEAMEAAKGYFRTINDVEFANALGDAAGESDYRAGMKRTGELMARRSGQQHVPAIRIARMFAHAGDKDSAMRWLEQAYEARESPLARLGVFWDWDGLRSDARFRDLLARMNLGDTAKRREGR